LEAWSNIEVPANDPEIIQINHLEEKLGKLPEKVRKIRIKPDWYVYYWQG